MARTYKRDSRGRFAGGGGGSARPATRSVSRGTNRLTRDNSGRITSVGGNGATARGGRLRTGAGGLRAKQTARVKGTGGKLRKPISRRPLVSRAEPIMTGGTLAARSSLRRARQNLNTNPSPAQRGAVTRASRYARAAMNRDTQPRKISRPASVMRRRPPEMPLRWQVGVAKSSGRAKNNIRPIGIRQAKNIIKPLSVRSKRNPQLTASKKKITKFARQAMRLQRNYSVAQKDVSKPRNRQTMRVAERAFAYMRTPRNSISPGPRRRPGGGSAATRR